jgi:hypothetical protein
MTFLHEFMLCNLQISVPHKAKETGHSVLVSFLATESIMPFCWLTYFYIAFVVMKSGNLNFLETSGSLQASKGTALPFSLNY